MPELLKALRATTRLVTSTLVFAVALLALNGCHFWLKDVVTIKGVVTNEGTLILPPCGPEAPCQPRVLNPPMDQVGGIACVTGTACKTPGAPCNYNSGTCTLAIIGAGPKCGCVCN